MAAPSPPARPATGSSPAASAPASTSLFPGAPVPLRHTAVDDVFGLLTGVLVASLGLYLLKAASLVTGGTAGLALLISYASPVPFPVLFLAVNAPFFVLAAKKKGWKFTLRTALCVALFSAFSFLHPLGTGPLHLESVYAAVFGNLLAGIGLLILFRHGSSLGGFNILALILQERLGWRAGYVQMVLDIAVVLSSFAVVPAGNVLLSAAGAAVLNLVLAVNHRPGRYLGL
jgi:uncharacterized membrane-anchored protein YitT (DUF2179 family)